MGLRDRLFGRTATRQPLELPAILQPEDPVNYDTVLNWLLGLSQKDYGKMLKAVETYRVADKTVARILNVKDEPTTQLVSKKLTDEDIDAGLDTVMQFETSELVDAIENEKPASAPKKAQSPGKRTSVNKDA